MRVATVVGTRPEIIRLSRVIAELDKHFEHTLIHTGQNYDHELNAIFFEQMKIRKPDHVMDSARCSSAQSTANMMYMLDPKFDEVKPEAVLILGDTNSCLAAAYVAKRKKIPLFHMEAGNRSFDQRIPEEINRVMIDHISDINLPYSEIARQNLLREGLPSDRIIKTGSPMKEILDYYSEDIDRSNVLTRLNLRPDQYFVVSSHREENMEKFAAFMTLLNGLAAEYRKRIVVSAHPRLYSMMLTWRDRATEIETYKPFGFFDYIALQRDARMTLSDSGTLTEESSILGFGALNLREAHERPEGMEEMAVPLVGYSLDRALAGIKIVDYKLTTTPADYSVDNVSDKIPGLILSYTDYVNRNVWRKP